MDATNNGSNSDIFKTWIKRNGNSVKVSSPCVTCQYFLLQTSCIHVLRKEGILSKALNDDWYLDVLHADVKPSGEGVVQSVLSSVLAVVVVVAA